MTTQKISGRFNERLAAALFGVFSLVSCGGSITYTPEDDAEALKRIEKTWTAAYSEKTFSLTICEDLEANAVHQVDGCTYAHLVRSVDPSPKDTVDRASSCEDCFLGIMTNIIGTFHDAQGKEYVLKGIVSLGTEFNEDPYEGDFGLMLSLDDGRTILEGRITEEGTIVLSGDDLYALGFDVDEAEEKIENFEEGQCGAPEDSAQENAEGNHHETADGGDSADAGSGNDASDQQNDADSEGEEDIDASVDEGEWDGGQDPGSSDDDASAGEGADGDTDELEEDGDMSDETAGGE